MLAVSNVSPGGLKDTTLHEQKDSNPCHFKNFREPEDGNDIWKLIDD